jgi:uncharacterized membrane protein (DUF485 family)
VEGEMAMATTPSTGARSEGTPPAVMRRKRVALIGGATMFGLFILYPVLTAFTPVLDGAVSGIGVAYIAGFLEIVAAMVAAAVYCRWADRVEAAADRPSERMEDRA